MFAQEFCFYNFKRYSIKTNTFHYNSLLPLQRIADTCMSVKVPYALRLVLSSRDKSYISEIRDQSRDSVIARSRVTEALIHITTTILIIILGNGHHFFISKPLLLCSQWNKTKPKMCVFEGLLPSMICADLIFLRKHLDYLEWLV